MLEEYSCEILAGVVWFCGGGEYRKCGARYGVVGLVVVGVVVWLLDVVRFVGILMVYLD